MTRFLCLKSCAILKKWRLQREKKPLLLKTLKHSKKLFRKPSINPSFCTREWKNIPSSAGWCFVFWRTGTGGHNVIAAFRCLHTLHPQSTLIGFLGGLVEWLTIKQELSRETIAPYRNQGDSISLIGKTKIETRTAPGTLATVKQLQFDECDLSWDDSNTNSAISQSISSPTITPTKWFLNLGVFPRQTRLATCIKGTISKFPFGFGAPPANLSEMIRNIARWWVSAKNNY